MTSRCSRTGALIFAGIFLLGAGPPPGAPTSREPDVYAPTGMQEGNTPEPEVDRLSFYKSRLLELDRLPVTAILDLATRLRADIDVLAPLQKRAILDGVISAIRRNATRYCTESVGAGILLAHRASVVVSATGVEPQVLAPAQGNDAWMVETGGSLRPPRQPPFEPGTTVDWEEDWKYWVADQARLRGLASARDWVEPVSIWSEGKDVPAARGWGAQAPVIAVEHQPHKVVFTFRWGTKELAQRVYSETEICEDADDARFCDFQGTTVVDVVIYGTTLRLTLAAFGPHSWDYGNGYEIVELTPPEDFPVPFVLCTDAGGRFLSSKQFFRQFLDDGSSDPSMSAPSSPVADVAESERLRALLDSQVLKPMRARALRGTMDALHHLQASGVLSETELALWSARFSKFDSDWHAEQKQERERAQAERRLLAEVPQNGRICTAEFRRYEKLSDELKRAAVSGRPSAVMRLKQQQQGAAERVCEASQALQAAIDLYQLYGMSDAADAVRHAYADCLRLCR